MKMTRSLLAAITLSSITALSFAAAAPSLSSTDARNSMHIGLDLGYAGIQSPATEVYTQNAITNGSASYKIGHLAYGANLGYDFALAPSWLLGPELGYYNFGYSQYKGTQGGVFNDNTKIRSSAADALARLTWMSQSGFNVFGKVGAAYVFQKADSVVGFSNTAASNSRSTHTVAPEGDLGMGYQFANGLNLSVDYQHIFGHSESNDHFITSSYRAHNVYSTNALLGEVSYRFGV